MAGIDKTFVNNWEDFVAIRNWTKSVGTITERFGKKEVKYTPYDWLYYPEITEEEFNKRKNECWEEAKERYSRPDGKKYYSWYIEEYGEDFINNPDHFFEMIVWNTTVEDDVVLIRNCPLNIIQERLSEQYSSKFIQDAKNHVSNFDRFERKGIKHPHISIDWKINNRIKDKNLWWWIDIVYPADPKLADTHGQAWYSSSNQWFFEYEATGNEIDGWVSSTCTKYKGPISMRKLRRIISKWDLPKGTVLHFKAFWGRRTQKEFLVTVK